MGEEKKFFVSEDEVMKQVDEGKVKMADLRFSDLYGEMQHVSVRADLLGGIFKDGHGFDGSSIPGFQNINESDLLLVPDASRSYIDPFLEVSTVAIHCSIKDPVSGKVYSRDPRSLAQRAEAFLKKSGIADGAFFGPELEFFIFDKVSYGSRKYESFFHVQSREAPQQNHTFSDGISVAHKTGYFPIATDKFQNVRTEMLLTLNSIGVDTEIQHHEVASFGQAEIDMRFDSLVAMADKALIYKYVVRKVAEKHGLTVTFMPKPIYKDNGSGMHVHQSLWKDGKNLFHNEKWDGKSQDERLSPIALQYAAGLLEHAPSLMAFLAPSTNSYKRLVPGFEAPVNLVYSSRNRSAAIRIPTYFVNPKTTRLEFRPPDPLANPYLAFSAMLLAGMDGIAGEKHPGKPMHKDTYTELTAEEKRELKTVPGSLESALDALKHDYTYLLHGNVFDHTLLDIYIDKKQAEADLIHLSPHPREFELYYAK